MAKPKTKRERKREERDQREVEEQLAVVQFERRRRLYRIAAAVIPLLTLAISIGVYVGANDRQLAALLGMVGIAAWIPVVLGALASSIRPRDRGRAGSIDFGNRR